MNKLSFKIDFQRLFLGYPSVKWTIGSSPGNPPETKISFVCAVRYCSGWSFKSFWLPCGLVIKKQLKRAQMFYKNRKSKRIAKPAPQPYGLIKSAKVFGGAWQK